MRLKEILPKEFWSQLDSNIKLLAREIRKDLREENDHVIAITGYPGVGKSNDAAIVAALIDDKYSFEKNVCFIPSSKGITEKYRELPMYSVMHIDEASRGLHKHKWYDKIQQTLTTLYDTEREGHYLCTLLLMPRFQNFTEYFRNFRIKYWIHIPRRGIAIVYRRDEDKDVKDPWHLDENYKKKMKRWKGKRIFERGLGETIRVEQLTENYWFYFKIPKIPEDIWEEYKILKEKSREILEQDGSEIEAEDFRETQKREKLGKWTKAYKLHLDGKTYAEIAAIFEVTDRTIKGWFKDMKEWKKAGKIDEEKVKAESNNIFNNKGINNSDGSKGVLTKE